MAERTDSLSPPSWRERTGARPTSSQPQGSRSLLAARAALLEMSAALRGVAERLDNCFEAAVQHLLGCLGHVHVVGIGKSHLVAQKVAATLASTGTPASALHATEAMHGDIGRVRAQDVVLLLSHSGQTEEVVRLAALVRELGALSVAMTADDSSALARTSELTVCYGAVIECEPLRLVPTTSAIAMMAVGDALALACLSARDGAKAIYAQRHPAGALGRRLQSVRERMRHHHALPIASQLSSLAEVLSVMTDTPGGPGAACLIDADGRLVGLFTDGDLRRLLLQGPIERDVPIARVMRKAPRSVEGSLSVAEAAQLLTTHHIDQLPVVDADGRPVGLLDIQDVVSPGGG